jgi:serine/threonine protein kinase
MDAVVSQTRRFARYEIIRKLGRSMTDVYLAFDPRTARRVILKLIEESRDDLTQVVIEAEKRGAQIQSELHRLDPRIIEIYECGNTQGHFFIAMEYFEGKNILEILQLERRLEARRAAKYAAEMCSQLERLHSFVSDVDGKKHAVVHGDIKPSNIQIGRNDELRLLDFGISKVITSTRNLTRHNLGSPTYCSPERLSKGIVDAQADLWAVGVSLYEMVAGAPPYQAQDTRKLENLIQSKRPPRSLPSTCPPVLAAIVWKALAAEIDRRYASAADFHKDLRAYLDGTQTVAFAEKRPSWDSNDTVQKFQPEIVAIDSPPTRRRSATDPQPTRLRAAFDKVTRRIERAGKKRDFDWFRFGSIVAGILAIFLLAYLVGRLRDEIWPARNPVDYAHASVAEINGDWTQYLKMKQRDAFLGGFSPARMRGQELKASFTASADEVIDGYHNSSDPSPESVDWAKAELCLRHAEEIDPDDRTIAGKLFLCEGYETLVQNPKLPNAARSEPIFRKAIAKIPKSPDPHLALARLYVYSYLNVGRALAELHSAERLGFRFGPREIEEQGDGYLFRAELELKQAEKSAAKQAGDEEKFIRLAHDDMDRARNLYEPISGFSNVSVSLNRLDRDADRADKLEPDSDPPDEIKKTGRGRGKPSSDAFSKLLSHFKWQ